MAKQSFVFCKVCNTMFLKSEVKDHSCPGCECDFDEYRPENWELDPFDPQSWSFGYKEFKVIESVHGKSSNEVLEIKSRSMATRIVEHLFLLLGGLGLCGVVLILIVLYSIDTLSSTLLFFIGIYSLVLAFKSIKRIFISVDSKNVYLINKYGWIYKREFTYPRKECSVRSFSSLDQSGQLPANTGVVTRDFKLVYKTHDNNERLMMLPSCPRGYEIEAARWLTTYVKYAYNEELLPEPEAKYGKALPPTDDDDKQEFDEVERSNVQDET